MAEKTKINKVFIVGTLQEVNTNIRFTSDGREYISGKVVIKTEIDEVENLIEMKLFAFAKTKIGADNKNYLSYKTLDGMIGKKVKISGEFRDGSMVNQLNGTINHFNELYIKFVNSAKPDETDQATFNFSGFVVKSIYERRNKEDELLGYRIEVGQANYNNTNMQVIKFDIHKDDLSIAQAIEANYLSGLTVSFSGKISSVIRTETKVEEVAFGEPTLKTFVVVDKMYRIKGGDEPLSSEHPEAYTEEEIKDLIAEYKKSDLEKIENSRIQDTEDETPVVKNEAASKIKNLVRTGSLI